MKEDPCQMHVKKQACISILYISMAPVNSQDHYTKMHKSMSLDTMSDSNNRVSYFSENSPANPNYRKVFKPRKQSIQESSVDSDVVAEPRTDAYVIRPRNSFTRQSAPKPSETLPIGGDVPRESSPKIVYKPSPDTLVSTPSYTVQMCWCLFHCFNHDTPAGVKEDPSPLLSVSSSDGSVTNPVSGHPPTKKPPYVFRVANRFLSSDEKKISPPPCSSV